MKKSIEEMAREKYLSRYGETDLYNSANYCEGFKDGYARAIEGGAKDFKHYVGLFLEDHENFQNGFEDEETAFNEQDEDESPYDRAEHAFEMGYLSAQKEIDQKDKKISGLEKMIELGLGWEDMKDDRY